MKVACYCRVSTKKGEQLESLEKQIEFFTNLMENNPKYELYKIYHDDGISAKQMKNRKQFLEMIEDAKNKEFDAILVKDITRFSRNTVDFLVSIRELNLRGINVIFVTYGQETLKEESELNLTMQIAFAQEESARLSVKTKFGKNITAKKGRVPTFVFGYNRVDNYTVVPNQEEADIVKKMFDLYVNEGFGTGKIAEYLNKNNVRTKKNKQIGWTQKTVIDILRNELYVGNVVNKKSEIVDFLTGKRKKLPIEGRYIVERPEFQIIDKDTFKKAQHILESRKDAFKLDKKRASTKYPLSNLIKCSECGYSFRRCQRQYVKGGKIYSWWTCSYRNAKGKGICSNDIRADESELYEAITAFFKQLLSNRKEARKAITQNIEAMINDYNKNIKVDRIELNKELNEYTREKEKYMDMYKNEIISMEELKGYTVGLNEKIGRLKVTLGTYNNQSQITLNIEKLIDDYFEKIDNITTSNNLDNVLLKQIIEKILVYPDGEVKVVLKFNEEHNLSFEMPLEIVEEAEEIGHSDLEHHCTRM